jgi:hypothetical protein
MLEIAEGVGGAGAQPIELGRPGDNAADEFVAAHRG